MSVRMNLVLSDDLNSAIEKVVSDSESNKSEVIRKALQLFIAAQEGKKRGLKLGLVEPSTRQMETEFVGL
ncbi:MAG: transcriptional regulator [Rhodobacteraceae bacterium]|nr:MAG: transcriptional regulator [Paracoccaceae bacterium]